MLDESLKIELFQQIICAITAARANQRSNIIAFQQLLQFLDSTLNRAGKIKISFENSRQINGLITHLAQSGDALFEQLGLDIACGSNDPYLVARLQSWWF